MITRLQFVILCRVQRGLPAFGTPTTHATPSNVIERRREAIADLYRKRLLRRGLRLRVGPFGGTRTGPVLTARGREALDLILNPPRDKGGRAMDAEAVRAWSARTGEALSTVRSRRDNLRRTLREAVDLEAVAARSALMTREPMAQNRDR